MEPHHFRGAGLMALRQAAVVGKIRDLLATVTGIDAAFSAADADDTRLPQAMNMSSSTVALVVPGATLVYILSNGAHRHTYEVKVQVMQSGAEPGTRASVVSVMPDRVLEKIVSNVALGGLCNSCVFRGSSGLVGIEYGGETFTGYEITLEVSEQAAATPAFGS